MSQLSRWHFPLLSIATLAFALGTPTAAPAQNPCASASDAPSAQCKEWQKQQKLNVACMQNPNRPECKDWLQKQSHAGRTKPTRPTQAATGNKGPGNSDTKGLKRGKGGVDEKGIIIINSKSKSGTNLPAVQNQGMGGTGAKGIILQNRGK